MEDLEKIYEDKKNWIFFKGETKHELIWVYCKCPECSKYVKQGIILINRRGEIKFQGFVCKQHGEIQPYYDRAWSEIVLMELLTMNK